ncbi:MAG: hypothetical protein GX114_00755 [Clostridiales bacterium]|nr:hypothetical protein [Clostridiales bacterium]
MLRKTVLVLLCVVLVFSLAACNAKRKINEKIAEKVTEGVLEKIAGDGTEIDISEGGITFEGEGGEKITFGSDEWPKGGAADLIPEFKKGSIVSAVNANPGCVIVLEDVEKKDVEDYIKKVKEKGFTEEAMDLSGSDGFTNYVAGLDEKTFIAVVYDKENKGLSINVKIDE